MNEIINLLQQKTGMSKEMAQQAVQIVVGHLKSRLPGPMASGLDSFLGAGEIGPQETGGGTAQGLMGSLEGLMGGNKGE